MNGFGICIHGNITMTCPACKGGRTLPTVRPQHVTPPNAYTAAGLLPHEMAQMVPDVPDSGPIGSIKIDLGAVVDKASKMVGESSHRSNATYRPPPVA